MLRQVNSWGDTVHGVSERQWTVVLDAAELIDPPKRIDLRLPQPKVEATVAYQAYVDMDLVDLDEPVATVGQGEPLAATNEWIDAADPRLLYVVVGGGALLLLLLLVVVLRAGRSRERPLRVQDVFRMPAEIDGFVVVQLLRALGTSDLVRMSPNQRAEMQQDIKQIQSSCFGDNGDAGLTEEELRRVARKWLRAAR
jgi:hypothetical protein